MTPEPTDRMRGAPSRVVTSAIEDGDPFPGTRGFGGQLPDGRLVRDVLGRQPVFVSQSERTDGWGFSPPCLSDPEPLPAGHVRSADGIERVFSIPDSPVASDEYDVIEKLQAAIQVGLDSVGDANFASDVDEADLAVAFSGGVDSAVVASAFDAPLYVVGFPGSHDVEAAREAARLMDREEDLRVVELDSADVERAVPEVALSTGRSNAMDVQIALPLYLAAERAAADGFGTLAVGQGADELFGGYAKVARAPDDPRVEAVTVRGAVREVIETLPDQLERDVLAIRAGGVESVAPLLHDEVVKTALELPGDLLVDSRGERKKAFRLAAREFVPDRVAFREKKALQYGSLVARELDRLARQSGFKRRMDDHVSKYVQSRIEK